MSLRNFFRLLRHGPPSDGRGVDDSLAKAANDSLHVCASGSGAGGSAYSPTSGTYKQIEEGYKNYAESFKKNKKK